ncbi:ATP-binding cassette domain-containing protein [Modestobacter sp. I12A-02628]|uniref:ABC transporter ATP-binding protein n=1 Tax=Goekera deserti TaxID=2497753 RepID=A0A7K3WE28_9ACTN|nr:ABC transporter ATP-binding protein [Goekera deserti]MPQ98590.1 ATP-binding cassette domain-containing protein [Goekera deserti]NDI49040.1 ATP-binding cassette domain-containing protein [Goekera deserti]NEL54169.1 ABC transporter ATP-binding protein [Goekera deserti]
MTTTEREPVVVDTVRDAPAVCVRGLRKSYGGRAVLDGLDLEVSHGECVALLGPNGAGKTTTIEILEGVRARDAGQVLVLGEDPAVAGRGWRARVGVVTQGEAAGQALTVLETVEHFAVYHARPRPTADLLEAVGLQEQSGTRVAQLSGGQRRRLAVALGVQGDPDLVFLDEPTTGMDPVARRQFWELVRGLRAAGTTVVLTTHYLDEAAELADRVAVVSAGRLVEVAPPRELGASLRRQVTVTWTEDGRPRQVRTEKPEPLLRDLLLTHRHQCVPDLTVTRPTLEDVYLQLIGATGPTEERP